MRWRPKGYAWRYEEYDPKELFGRVEVELLYTRPQPTAQWVGLTDDEVQAIRDRPHAWKAEWFARAIEAKLREKNGG